MDRPEEPLADLLAEISPIIEVIFYACGLSVEEARKIIESSCLAFTVKERRQNDPEGWLLWLIVQRCRTLRLGNKEEEEIEDPPE